MSFHLGIWNAMSDGQRVQECAKLAAEIERLRSLAAEMRNSNGELRFHLGRLERELAEARGLLERCVPSIDRGMSHLHADIAAFLAEKEGER
jgi:hypothetical protein